jgi:hypothetical protein
MLICIGIHKTLFPGEAGDCSTKARGLLEEIDKV